MSQGVEFRKAVRFILCRHTQTDDNVAQRLCGARQNPALNGTGVLQADALAGQLAAFPVEAIYASDLTRAMQLATRIATPHGLEVILDKRLRETDIGELSGLRKEEAHTRFPEPYLRTAHPNYDFRSVGGESRKQVIDRELECLNELCAKHGMGRGMPTPHIVVVGHGTALRDIRMHLGQGSDLHEQGQYQLLDFYLQ